MKWRKGKEGWELTAKCNEMSSFLKQTLHAFPGINAYAQYMPVAEVPTVKFFGTHL